MRYNKQKPPVHHHYRAPLMNPGRFQSFQGMVEVAHHPLQTQSEARNNEADYQVKLYKLKKNANCSGNWETTVIDFIKANSGHCLLRLDKCRKTITTEGDNGDVAVTTEKTGSHNLLQCAHGLLNGGHNSGGMVYLTHSKLQLSISFYPRSSEKQ